jgi:hypothetical protein
MPRKVVGLSVAYWGIEPPCTREQAEAEFGAAIPEDVWERVVQAFDRHAENMGYLEKSVLNNNPNDKQSWTTRLTEAKKRISKAIGALDGIDRRFVADVEECCPINFRDSNSAFGLEQRLKRALDDMLHISMALHTAAPIEIEVLTEPESKKRLTRDIFELLEPLGAKVSNGWNFAYRDPSFADLTGFERLIDYLGIAQSDTPGALSKWIQRAITSD